MPIRRHLPEQYAFEPEAITAMSTAFEAACAALSIYAGDTRGREIIAARIIDLASHGLLDATALRDRVIEESRVLANVYSTVSNDNYAA